MGILYTLFKIGYDKDGYDKNGYDRYGYNKNGYDRNGNYRPNFVISNMKKNSHVKDSFDNDGYDKDEYDHDKSKFIKALEKYKSNEKDSEVNLAIYYLKGIGVERDTERAFSLIVEGAFNNSFDALKLLGDCYYTGDIITKNITLSQFIYDLAGGKDPLAINQYKAMTPTTFNGISKVEKSDLIHEENHLAMVISCIEKDIKLLEGKSIGIDRETWWMDRDQLENWRKDKFQNSRNQQKIYDLKQIKVQPYYARMDTILSDSLQTHYIGEEPYFNDVNPEMNVVSVWSEYGRRYRSKNVHEFSINGYKYQVTLRRRFDIINNKVNKIFNDYVYGSEQAKAQITDPYLLKVLEEKKGESNITNIIRSIQLNQNDIIEYPFDQNLIVQGCAGSGKTMILLHRLANIKYNLPSYDLRRVKIITPNNQFNLFVDELSKNIKIDEIEKVTLNEYYVFLLDKYRNSNQESYDKIIISTKDGIYIEEEVRDSRKTGPSENAELKTISHDINLEFDIVTKIYSNKFVEKITKEAQVIKQKEVCKIDYGRLMLYFKEVFKKALIDLGINKKINLNYTCVLHSKLLFLYTYYGSINRADSLLCIDEGQDISEVQYDLINKINGKDIKFNIYGDLNQQIPGYYGIKSWVELSKIIGSKIFVMSENYRNSDDIIKYYNKTLQLDNKSFGLKTKPVKTIPLKSLVTEVKLQLLLKNRTAIIKKESTALPLEIKEICSSDVLTKNKAVLLNIRESKGLEFDSVFVLNVDMNRNERYISYSRALSELYIVIN